MKKKILVTFGTRPEAIKMLPLYRTLQSGSAFETRLCITAQHREMLDQVLAIFDTTPHIDLDLMEKSQGLDDLTSRVLIGMRDVLAAEKPDLVMVHGDTTTTFAASLAAFYQQIPVAHVEAGLRTWNRYSPWPEEMNRQLTSRIARWHFTPTEKSRTNLLNEHVPDTDILVTGNTVIDALFMVRDRLRTDEQFRNSAEKGPVKQLPPLDKRRYILVTGHRRENFGSGFENICRALTEIADRYPDIDIVYPVHLNPRVQDPVKRLLSNQSNIRLLPPVPYGTFVHLMQHAHIIITDSGGIQEEAPALGIPVLVMRDTTERPEALEAGTVRLVGTDRQMIVNTTAELLDDPAVYERMASAKNPYGDGHASERIADFLSGHL